MNVADMFCRMNCSGMVEDEKNIWFSWTTANGFCHIDKESGEVEILERFNGFSGNQGDLYHSIQKIGGEIIFAPAVADHIAVYDLLRKKMSYINLSAVDEAGRKETYPGIKFWSSISYGSFVYMFGYSYPAIVKLNVETKKVEYLAGWVGEVERKIRGKTDDRGYFLDGVVLGHYAFIPCGCTNAVLKLDFLTDETEVISLNTLVDGFGGLSFDGENFWIVGRGMNSNRLICWNAETQYLQEIAVGDWNDDRNRNIFWGPICQNGIVYLFPLAEKHIYKATKQNGKIKVNICKDFECSEIKSQCLVSDGMIRMMCPHLYGKIIRFITCHDFIWHEYNMETGKLYNTEIRLKFSEKLISEKIIELLSVPIMESKWCAYQDNQLLLSVYLDCITKYSDMWRNYEVEKNTGEKVWENLLPVL